MSFRHGIARNLGAALGLFAMIIVTLLAPVHQTHAAQRDLARAGGDLSAALVICHGDLSGEVSAATPDEGGSPDGKALIDRCPVCSLAKQVGAAPAPTLPGTPATWRVAEAPVLLADVVASRHPERVSQPRAPPIPV